MMSVIESVLAQQKRYVNEPEVPPGEHRPELLLLGCVDARISVRELGIERGMALIHRSVGAAVTGLGIKGELLDMSEAAALDFAVQVMKVRHVAVMGHTDCGGMRACIHHHDHNIPASVHAFLKPMLDLAKSILADDTIAPEHKQRAMERSSVRESVKRLMSYPCVAEAVGKGELTLHGWLLHTGSKRIEVLNPETGRFTLMAETT